MFLRPKRPRAFLSCILNPSRYWETYIEVSDLNICINRYYAANELLQQDKALFPIREVKWCGLAEESPAMVRQDLASGRYGSYKAGEIHFVLWNDKVIPFDSRPYTKKQLRTLMGLLPEDAEKGEGLCQMLGI